MVQLRMLGIAKDGSPIVLDRPIQGAVPDQPVPLTDWWLNWKAYQFPTRRSVGCYNALLLSPATCDQSHRCIRGNHVVCQGGPVDAGLFLRTKCPLKVLLLYLYVSSSSLRRIIIALWFTRDAGKAGGAGGRLALLPEREMSSQPLSPLRRCRRQNR